jgi:hypothetical protein
MNGENHKQCEINEIRTYSATEIKHVKLILPLTRTHKNTLSIGSL